MPPRGTEGRTNTEFAGSLLYRVGHYASQTDSCETEGYARKDSEEHCDEALMRPDEHGKKLVHRVDVPDCLVLIESANVGADGVEKGGGIAGGTNEYGCALGVGFGGCIEAEVGEPRLAGHSRNPVLLETFRRGRTEIE